METSGSPCRKSQQDWASDPKLIQRGCCGGPARRLRDFARGARLPADPDQPDRARTPVRRTRTRRAWLRPARTAPLLAPMKGTWWQPFSASTPRTGVALDPVAGPHRPSLPDSLTGALNRGPLNVWSGPARVGVGVRRDRGARRLPGSIGREPRGDGGLGYDPVFLPAGSSRTAAELTPVEKDAMSHGSPALAFLLPALRELTSGWTDFRSRAFSRRSPRPDLSAPSITARRIQRAEYSASVRAAAFSPASASPVAAKRNPRYTLPFRWDLFLWLATIRRSSWTRT